MNILFYGATGQCKIMYNYMQKTLRNFNKIDAIDDTDVEPPNIIYDKFLCGQGAYKKWKNRTPDYSSYNFLVTIGNPHGKARCDLSKMLKEDGLSPLSIFHESFIIDGYFGEGTQGHAGGIIHTNARAGNFCIFNTGSILEHDCIIGNGVEIGPGATVCGEVTIGDYTWIGAGSVIRDKIKIGKNVIVGAGSVVVKDVPDNCVIFGNPAKIR